MFRAPLLALAFAAAPSLVTAQDEPSPIADAIARADRALDAIATRPAAERTLENTVRAIDDVQARFFLEARMPGFLGQVSTDPDERDLGERASIDLRNWFDRLLRREDLYHAVQSIAERELPLEGEGARYLARLLRDFRRAGMALPVEQRARLALIDEQLTELGAEFQKNINDDESVLLLTAEECQGVPQDFRESLPRLAGLYVVELKGPSVRPFWNNCEVEDTRRKLTVAYNRRGGQKNVGVLEKMIALRAEKAHILGYEDIAEYEIEVKMAQEPETVWSFYEDLRPKLREKALADFAEFEAAKREHTGDPNAQFGQWDFSFYASWLMRERYAVDREKVREYLPLENVVQGLFEVTQELFGLRFEDATGRAEEKGRLIWHEDVRLFEVHDRESGELLGEFYIDLHPRPGKYTHAAQFPLALRKRWPDGSLTLPLVALVCNFTKPTAERPALLTHDEVETFFHEFGHCLHSILTEADYAEFSGTAVARDFVEAPSQMLENWIWDAGVLARFAKHYETGEPLPKEMLDGLVAAKNLGSGLSTEGQVFLGMMDLAFHTDPDGIVDTNEVRNRVYAETRLFESLDVPSQAAFGHMVGYEAGYYGYLWSLVYAQDMFSRFEKEGIMNPAVAAEYREKILAQGGTREALDMVRDFLGREPNSDAFLRSLGLD